MGRYQVEKEIGRGGCASVYRAHDADLNRDVALKVLPSYHDEGPSFLARFKQEARAVAGLSHPNILPVYDFGEERGFTYLVTKHVPGGTLGSRMARRYGLAEVERLATPLASAVDYARQQGIVHRDFKPSNVLLDTGAVPILADFGIARILESSVHITRTGWILGTPQYMSPEQALGRPADHRSDLYSFAVVLYELLLGRPPFKAETPVATLLAQVHECPCRCQERSPRTPTRAWRTSFSRPLPKTPTSGIRPRVSLHRPFACYRSDWTVNHTTRPRRAFRRRRLFHLPGVCRYHHKDGCRGRPRSRQTPKAAPYACFWSRTIRSCWRGSAT